MKLLLLMTLINIAYILTFCLLVIAFLMVIQDVRAWNNRHKPKKFKISPEVDYIMSRGVITIERSKVN